MKGSEGNRIEAWVRRTLKALATEYFPGRTAQLEGIVRGLAARHEAIWRSQRAGSYRPTESMYALALRWELDHRGPICSVCKAELDASRRFAPGPTTGPHLSLTFRRDPSAGGLNVPQNLALCHEGCAPSFPR